MKGTAHGFPRDLCGAGDRAGCGLRWLVLARGGREAVVGITVGAAGIAAELSGALRPRGPESEAALRAIRRRIRSDMAAHAAVEGPDAEADLAAADAAMERALRGCFLDRASLAASERSREGFDLRATRGAVAQLQDRMQDILDVVRRMGAPISTASEVDSVHVELIVNDRGESLILHDRPFPYPLDRVEYDPASGMIWFVIPGGFRKSFGVPVRPELARHLDRHTGRVLVVRADARNGEPIDGGYCPLRTI